MVEFGKRFKQLRLQNKMTQSQIALKLGLTKSVISAYETGLRMPSYDVLVSTAKVFHVSTDYLLGLEPPKLLDLSGLSPDEKKYLVKLVSAMKSRS